MRPLPHADPPLAAPAYADMRMALARGQLEPFFQPVVDLCSRRVRSAEALLRWRRSDHQLLLPDDIVPLLVRHGQWKSLTLNILDQALVASRDWMSDNIDLPVSVNIPWQMLSVTNLSGLLKEHVKAAGLSPEHLLLEFSEAGLAMHWDMADRQLAWLKAAGFGIVLDEYGLGLGLGHALDPRWLSAVKVDRQLVSAAQHDSRARSRVRQAIAIAKRNRIETIAVGVNEAGMIEILSAAGCDQLQGHGISPPLPAARLPRWISAWET